MDLTVRIPKRYKNTLSKRFNPKYAEQLKFVSESIIPIRCSLCDVHYTDNGICNNCTFVKFKNSNSTGCNNWIRNIYGRKKRYWKFTICNSFIAFNNSNKAKAIKSLNWFRDRAEQLIEWV